MGTNYRWNGPDAQMTEVDIEPKIGHEGAYHLNLKWGERITPPL